MKLNSSGAVFPPYAVFMAYPDVLRLTTVGSISVLAAGSYKSFGGFTRIVTIKTIINVDTKFRLKSFNTNCVIFHNSFHGFMLQLCSTSNYRPCSFCPAAGCPDNAI